MRRSTANKHTRTGAGLNHLLADVHVQGTLQDVPRFIVMVMEVRRSNQARWVRRAARIAPLGDHKSIFARTHDLSGK